MLKRKPFIALLLSTTLFLSAGLSQIYASPAESAVFQNNTGFSIISCSGYEEGAFAAFSKLSDADGYEAYISSDLSEWTKLDNELIREYPDYYRADAVGLTAGTWYIKLIALKSGTILAETISPPLTTENYDRSGFCFTNNASPGAYNADGSLKSGAKVVYITNDNISSLSNLFKSNSNSVCTYRFLGHIKYNSSAINVPALNKAITLEGIGEDATLNGSEIDVNNAKNVEIRNLGFMNSNVGDHDCISIKTSTYVWVHNNDMFYGMPGSDSDQKKGDGSIDCAKSDMITFSYNHMWDTGKVSLLGSGNSQKAESQGKKITYHHNWFDHTEERHPRIRFFTTHIYNNYYDGVSKYGIGATNNCSAFVENNYFRNSAYPMMISYQGSDLYRSTDVSNPSNDTFSSDDGGIIKSSGNIFAGNCTFIPYGKENHLNKGQLKPNADLDSKIDFDAFVCKKNETVPSSVTTKKGKFTYNNFDTSPSMYKYTADDTSDVPSVVMGKSGRLNGGDFWWNFNDICDDHDSGVNPELKAALLSYKGKMISYGGINKKTVPASLTDSSRNPVLHKKRSMTGNTDGKTFTDTLAVTESGGNTITATGNVSYDLFEATDFIMNKLNYPGSITKTYADPVDYNDVFSLSQFSLKINETNFITLLQKKGKVTINARDKGTLTVHAGSEANSDSSLSDIALYDSDNHIIEESSGETTVAQRQGTNIHYKLPSAGKYILCSPASSQRNNNLTLYSILLTTGEGDYTYDTPTDATSRYTAEEFRAVNPDVPAASPSASPTVPPDNIPSAIPTQEAGDVPDITPSAPANYENNTTPTAAANDETTAIPSASPTVSPDNIPSAIPTQEAGNVPDITPSAPANYENNTTPTAAANDETTAIPSASANDAVTAVPSAAAVSSGILKLENAPKAVFITGDSIKVSFNNVPSDIIDISGKAGIYDKSNGVLILKKKGTVKLFYKNGKKKNILCSIKSVVPSVKKSLKLKNGSSKKLKLSKYKPEMGTILWFSDNPGTAAVENGTVKGISNGTANIKAVLNGHEYCCRVTVK